MKDKIIISTLLLFGTQVCFGATIKERIGQRILDEIGNDTAIQMKIQEGTETDTTIRKKIEKITREEIEKGKIKIPIIHIEVIKLDILKIATLPIELVPMQIMKIMKYTPEELVLAIQKLTPLEIRILQTRIAPPEVLRVIIAEVKRMEIEKISPEVLVAELTEIDVPAIKTILVKYPQLKILGLKVLTPEEIRIVKEELRLARIEKLAILIYDLSYQAKALRNEIDLAVASKKLKGYLRDKNWFMVSNVLLKAGVTQETVSTLLSNIGKIPPKVQMPFFECVMGENAYVINTYKEEVKTGDVVILDISRWENRVKAVKFIEKNKDKIGAVIVGWENDGMNNFDNLDISTYPELAKTDEEFFTLIKGIKPEIPVGRLVCMTPTWKEYLEASTYSWDFIALWNVYKIGGNFKGIKERFFPNDKVMIAGILASRNPEVEFGGEKYRNYLRRIKQLGYCGSIFIKREGGEMR